MNPGPARTASDEPPFLDRPAQRALAAELRLGATAGMCAGLFCALGDFGATWLWLPVWRDRLGLLATLVGLLAPLGFALGALACACLVSSAVLARRLTPARSALLFPLPLTLLALFPLRVLALKLCSGGTMSRLPQRGAIELTLSVVFPLGAYGLLWLGARGLGWARRDARRGVRLAAALGLAAFGLGKLNQTVYPNLYDYLHAALAGATFGAAALSAWLLFQSERTAGRVERALRPLPFAALTLALAATLFMNARSLDDRLNVRVAMFDPRSPVSRALLAAGDPLLARIARAPERRVHVTQRARTTSGSGLPAAPGAHVLLVTIDALRADHLSGYGYERPTSPQLDAYGRQSLVFKRAYAQAPHSSYSLSSLHTSEYLHELVDLGKPLPRATLASVFRDHGYHTAAFFTDGIFHTEGHRMAQYRDSAFDFALFDHTNREAEEHTDRVLAEADRIVQRGESPSFLWVHYFDVHEPYQDTHFGTSDLDRYDSEILHTDRELARLLRELDRRFEREIVVAISADHGEEFREHGGVYHGSTLFDEQVRVPLILHGKNIPSGLVSAPVEVIDIAPTLLSAVGIAPAPSMRGKDLRVYSSETPAADTTAFSAVLTKRMALHYPLKLIADLRFNLFELYDLERDPSERRNLAGTEPDALADMRGRIYGWLDALEHPPGEDAPEGPLYERALAWGRLGDRRAVEPMITLLQDRAAPTPERLEAGQILAKLADEGSADALTAALDTQPPEVAAEAAIALGRMYDERARDKLVALVSTEDPYVRARAAVSLGRLRDERAVDALIDALWVAPSQYERDEAVRWLGRLRDPRATEPLLAVAPEFGIRYLVAVALGQLRDPRAYDALADMLRWEQHTNVRDEVVRGLGLMGDARALPLLVPVLRDEPALRNTAESLVRLGALERKLVGGRDFAPGSHGAVGLGGCQAGPYWHDWDYAGRTTCTTERTEAHVSLPLGPARRASGATLILRGRRVDTSQPSTLRVLQAGHELAALALDGNASEYRIALPAELLGGASLELGLRADPAEARVALDHALIVPTR